MENKKLLKFLLKDISDLEELILEKGNNGFDELEMEFMQNRVGGAKRLIQKLYEKMNGAESVHEIETSEVVTKEAPQKSTTPELKEEKIEKKEEKVIEPVAESLEEKKVEEPDEKVAEEAPSNTEEKEIIAEETTVAAEKVEEKPVEEEVVSVEEDVKKKTIDKIDLKEKKEKPTSPRLGDKFSKEKSVNDLIDVDNTKLEHKLSNRPVEKIKTAIGINDRFLYIRELFDGNADSFSTAVAELDNKSDLNEAVNYLQQNFKWEKNETSLKFVNLVKRRFANG